MSSGRCEPRWRNHHRRDSDRDQQRPRWLRGPTSAPPSKLNQIALCDVRSRYGTRSRNHAHGEAAPRIEEIVARASAPAGLVRRARVILLSAAGKRASEIAVRLRSSARRCRGFAAGLREASKGWTRGRRRDVRITRWRPRRSSKSSNWRCRLRLRGVADGQPDCSRSRWGSRAVASRMCSVARRAEASPVSHLQGQPRSGVCGEGEGRRRAVSESARARGRAERR